jgi:hypothetical protein
MKIHPSTVCLSCAILFVASVALGLYAITQRNGFAVAGAWIMACMFFCASAWYGNGGRA